MERKNFEFIVFLDILIEQGDSLYGLNVLTIFPEIYQAFLKLEKQEKNFKNKKIISKLKKKIDNILNIELSQIRKTISKFKIIQK